MVGCREALPYGVQHIYGTGSELRGPTPYLGGEYPQDCGRLRFQGRVGRRQRPLGCAAARSPIGQSLYPVEYYLRAALNGARSCYDLQTLDEVAQYYLVMLQFTEPVGTLLKRPNLLRETRERMGRPRTSLPALFRRTLAARPPTASSIMFSGSIPRRNCYA